MKVEIECPYCGHKRIENVYSQLSLQDKGCINGNCGNKQLIIRDLSSKIDYYQGAPLFPDKNKSDKDWF